MNETNVFHLLKLSSAGCGPHLMQVIFPSGTPVLFLVSWNVMPHAQKLHFVFPRNGRVHLNRQGRQFSRLLAAEVCASAVVMLDTPCSEVVWRVLAVHSIRQFPLHFPYRASLCAIAFQLESTSRPVNNTTYNNINNPLDAILTIYINNPNQLNMFRAMISPILRLH